VSDMSCAQTVKWYKEVAPEKHWGLHVLESLVAHPRVAVHSH